MSIAPSLSRMRRILLGALLAVSLGLIGLAVGTMIGGWLFVPPGSGLAGPVIALGYGVLAALALMLIGIAVAWRASPQRLRLLAYSAGILSALLLLALIMLAQFRSASAPIQQGITTLPISR